MVRFQFWQKVYTTSAFCPSGPAFLLRKSTVLIGVTFHHLVYHEKKPSYTLNTGGGKSGTLRVRETMERSGQVSSKHYYYIPRHD